MRRHRSMRAFGVVFAGGVGPGLRETRGRRTVGAFVRCILNIGISLSQGIGGRNRRCTGI